MPVISRKGHQGLQVAVARFLYQGIRIAEDGLPQPSHVDKHLLLDDARQLLKVLTLQGHLAEELAATVPTAVE